MLFDSDGKERVRIEGYLSKDDFTATLMNGLGRIAFVHKKYADAQRWYNEVVTRYSQSQAAPEAMYWRAVARYKATNDHAALNTVAQDLKRTYPNSVWAEKAVPWLH
jgi:TolA-binding protein